MTLAVLVHGGAGPHSSDDDVEGSKQGCLVAARVGFEVLKRGGSAVEAVEAATRVLEDDPLFNAGLGSALTRDGHAELDASIMNGATLAAGAVASVTCFQNPVSVARAVMEKSGHVFLVGAGAERFGQAQGLPIVPNSALVTERARRQLARHQTSFGTVGAVALDARGHLAAATSTGGTTGKLPGRVGDSPLIGCGTYADDRSAAVSCTGLGEAIIRATLARHAADLARDREAFDAARTAVEALSFARGEGGLILVKPDGTLGWAFSTERMSRAWVTDSTAGAAFGKERAIFEKEM